MVNAKEENGKLTESEKRTGRWAWKHTHQADGSVDYVEPTKAIFCPGSAYSFT